MLRVEQEKEIKLAATSSLFARRDYNMLMLLAALSSTPRSRHSSFRPY